MDKFKAIIYSPIIIIKEFISKPLPQLLNRYTPNQTIYNFIYIYLDFIISSFQKFLEKCFYNWLICVFSFPIFICYAFIFFYCGPCFFIIYMLNITLTIIINFFWYDFYHKHINFMSLFIIIAILNSAKNKIRI